jgi:phage terminase small subunit
MSKTKKDLTPMALRFVEEFLVDCNATQAAKRAGYSDPSYGRQLISQAHIKDAIQKAQIRVAQRTGITVNKIIDSLSDLYVECIEKKEYSSAVRCLELLGKHVGAWEKNNKQKNRTVNVQMNFTMPNKDK